MLGIDEFLDVAELVVEEFRKDVDDQCLVCKEDVGVEVGSGFSQATLLSADHLEEELEDLWGALLGVNQPLDHELQQPKLLQNLLPSFAIAVQIAEQIINPLRVRHPLQAQYFIQL